MQEESLFETQNALRPQMYAQLIFLPYTLYERVLAEVHNKQF
jgi:hypothetical protein